mgnify:CR=1 FL=1
MTAMETVDSPLSVLLVEDNPNDALLIRRHLEGAQTAFLPDDIVLHHEETLTAGVERLEENGIDVLLLDLGLPESDGAETFERVREHADGVPVVVLTNLRDEATAVDLLKQGAQDYLNKGSLNEEHLVKAVRYALERQEQKRELQRTTQRLEVLNRILSHDIRNDVQVLKAWSKRLRDVVAEEHVPDVQRIAETSEHIQELTENSRAFMRAVSGEADPETEPTRVDRVLQEELQKARSTYDATFEAEELPAATVAANEMLASVFRNLLSNAVQHNHGDDQRVWVSLDERPDAVRAVVADNGTGIPADRRDEIFGKGERGLESSGSGIGLYLVHTLVGSFGGEVQVEDSEAGGARFVVDLPKVERGVSARPFRGLTRRS